MCIGGTPLRFSRSPARCKCCMRLSAQRTDVLHGRGRFRYPGLHRKSFARGRARMSRRRVSADLCSVTVPVVRRTPIRQSCAARTLPDVRSPLLGGALHCTHAIVPQSNCIAHAIKQPRCLSASRLFLKGVRFHGSFRSGRKPSHWRETLYMQ